MFKAIPVFAVLEILAKVTYPFLDFFLLLHRSPEQGKEFDSADHGLGFDEGGVYFFRKSSESRSFGSASWMSARTQATRWERVGFFRGRWQSHQASWQACSGLL